MQSENPAGKHRLWDGMGRLNLFRFRFFLPECNTDHQIAAWPILVRASALGTSAHRQAAPKPCRATPDDPAPSPDVTEGSSRLAEQPDEEFIDYTKGSVIKLNNA